MTVTSVTGFQTAGNIPIATVAPSLFTLSNAGLAAAAVLRVSADGTQTVQPANVMCAAGSFVPNPINMGSATDTVYLTLFGTGLQAAGMANVKVTVGGVNAPVVYAGPQGNFAGLDQVNVQLTASGVAANPVQITFQ